MIDSEEFGGEVVVVKVVETYIAVLSTGHETAVWEDGRGKFDQKELYNHHII